MRWLVEWLTNKSIESHRHDLAKLSKIGVKAEIVDDELHRRYHRRGSLLAVWLSYLLLGLVVISFLL